MKKILTLLTICITFVQVVSAQTYQTDFLDGRILFKLKSNLPVSPNEINRKDQHSFSLEVALNKHPEIMALIANAGAVKLERPSYFTGKVNLQMIYRLNFTNFSQVDELIEKLTRLDIVEYAEKEPIYKTGFVPNDALHTGTNKWYHNLVGSEAAWDISLGSNSIKVAIVDNAVFGGHADLTTFLQRDVADNDNDATPPTQYSSDQAWSHGTHCAGLATADINNGIGMASLGGNVELIGIKTTPNSGTSNSIYFGYEGVQWACMNGANVVSMSYGGTNYSASMQSLINSYPNVVFLAAAGNSNSTQFQYPGAYDNVICVGSVDGNDTRSSFSNYNGTTPYVDIASPGGYTSGGLLSTVYTTSGTSYAKMGGTSMATPFAAGLVGLMLSINPALTPAQVEACLLNSGVNINQNMGPRINALGALQCVQATLTGDPIAAFTANPTSIIEGQSVSFIDNSSGGGNAITNWSWSFPGGSPSIFSGQTPPAITYATPGSYDVTLTVTNSQSTQSLTKTGFINVSPIPFGAWIKQNSGFSSVSRGINWINIVDENIVWATAYDGAAGANIQQFTKTTNGGATWTAGNINVGNSGLGISMVHGIDADNAWVVAYPTAGGQVGGVWKTGNAGSTWTKQTTASFTNAASFANVVHFWDANNGFCQGDPINGEFELYTTTNGGVNWTLVPIANIPNPLSGEYGYVRQIEVLGDNVWFTTNKGRIYHSTDKGLNWAVYVSPITDFGGGTDNGNLSFSDANNGIIINQAGNVYRTTNAGASWGQITPVGSVFTNGLCFIEGTNTVFSTGATPAGSSYSSDGGTTWTLIDSEQHLYVEMKDTNVGWSGWFNQSATENGMWKWNNTSHALQADFQGTPSVACAGSNISFTDNSTGGTPTSWTWSFPGGTPAFSTAQNPTVVYNTAGSYTVTLSVNDGNGQTSKQDTAHVIVESPAAMPSVISGPAAPCENANATYTIANAPGMFYTWTLPATWIGNSTTNSIVATVGSAGGMISVTADNICGSSAPRELNITLCDPAGLDDLSKYGVKIYPNPATTLINLDGLFNNEQILDNNIMVVDMVGKVVLQTSINSEKYGLNISSLTNGVYYIQMNGGNLQYKFVKQ